MATLNLQLEDPFKSVIDAGTAHTTPNGLPNTPIAPPVVPVTNSNLPYGPVQPTSVVVQPTVGSVLGTTPSAPTSTLDSIKQQALAIQAQIPGATGYTKAFNAPTPEAGFEDPYRQLTPQEERRIRREQMKMFQKEIDATNQIYDEMVRQERLAGEGRLGSQAAMGARSGLLGSDFQGAAEEGVRRDTAAIIGGVQAERRAKIAAIEGKGRQEAAAEIAAKNKANREGADAKIKFMSEKKDRQARNLKKLAASLIEQGLNPDELSAEELKALTTSYGTTEADIRAEYTSEKVAADKEAEKNKKDTTFTLGEGQARYDEFGNIIAQRAKTYAPKEGRSKSTDYDKVLLGGGWSGSQIDALEAGIEQYGLQEVIAQEEANGATPAQIKALEKAYKVPEADEEDLLTRENLAKIFGVSDDDTQSSIFGFEYGETGKEQLDTIEQTIERYRLMGYTNKEIFKMMQ